MTETTYSLDYVARTSEETAVRTQFDARTLTWLRVVAIAALVVSFPHAIAGTRVREVMHLPLGMLSLALSVALALSVRKKATGRRATFVRHRVRGVAMGFAVAQAAILSLYHAPGEGAAAIPLLIGLLALGYRLMPAEHVLLHAALAGVPTIVFVVFPHPEEGWAEMFIPMVVANAMFLMVSLVVSRRLRRNIVADWTERRAQAREQIRMRDELRVARELQLSMLPECAPALGWVDICSISIPATEVGGDYYDYFIDGDRVALICGDVAGHGMSSAIVLSGLRSGFTLLRDSLADPAAVLQRLHDLVAQTSRRRMLVTVSVLLLDRSSRRATIASAGHPPAVLRRADGSVEVIELFAPPLGVRLPLKVPQRTIAVKPGDVFVLHSDGIYESRNAQEEVYGLERMIEVVRAHGGGSAEGLRDALIADVERFRGTAMQADDVTVVVAKIA